MPGLAALLGHLDGIGPLYLVGGAVRDLLRATPSADLDLAVEGDAHAVARELADRLGGAAVLHDRFNTASVRTPQLSLDLAATRRERYATPGALPDVEPAGLAEDLGRRDFTVNAMAVSLHEVARGTLHDPHGGQADLEARTLRVLHAESFRDDPTRLLRALRYAARLELTLDPLTAELARAAIRTGALETVSGSRIRDELLDLLGEAGAPDAIALAADLGVLAALHSALHDDPGLVAGAQLGSAETGAEPALAALAALCSRAPDDLLPFIERLGLAAPARRSVLRAAAVAGGIAARLQDARRASELHALLEDEPPEALALALALGAPAEPMLRFLADLRGAALEITGEDLVAAGVQPSPAIGRALADTLRRHLDGEIGGREEQLATALAHVRDAS